MATTRRCRSKTQTGRPCAMRPGASGYCFNHDPARGRERAESRRRGGRARVAPKVADAARIPADVTDVGGVRAILRVALEDTIALDNTPARSRVLVSIAAAHLDCLRVGEHEARIAALEEALRARVAVLEAERDAALLRAGVNGAAHGQH